MRVRCLALVLGLCGCVGTASGADGSPSDDAELTDAGATVDADAAIALDAGIERDAGDDAGVDGGAGRETGDAGMADAGRDGGQVPLEECATASIDRLTYWSAPEGMLETASGVRWTLLVPEQGRQAAKVHFLGNDWHGALVMLTNATVFDTRADSIVDATNMRQLDITYSATSDFWVQLRSYDSFGGPNLFAALIPNSSGQRTTIHLSFDRGVTTWASLFQTPALGWNETLAQLKALAFVDNSENDLVFYGLRLDGYVPRCP